MKKNTKITLIIVAALLSIAGVLFWYFRKKPMVENFTPGNVTVNPNTIAVLPTGNFPLKKGDRNKSVYALQLALNFLHNANLVTDGIYGPLTENAVKSNYAGAIIVTAETKNIILSTLKMRQLVPFVNKNQLDQIIAEIESIWK